MCDSVPYQKRPSSRLLRAQDCGSAPDLPACSPCAATPPPCVTVLWGRPECELAPAPGTQSCGPLENTAGPVLQPVSSWRRWRPSHSAAGSGTVTPWHNHKGTRMVTGSVEEDRGRKEKYRTVNSKFSYINTHTSIQFV